jgi:HlyD family secretion protein
MGYTTQVLLMNKRYFKLKSIATSCLAMLLCVMTLLLLGCGQDGSKQEGTQTYIVKPEPFHKTLHFTGTIQPIKESTITNPLDAVVDTMVVSYGQYVDKNNSVFVLKSSELQKQYNDTLTEYLKAKDSYSVAKSKFMGTTDLWEAGLVSKNNYLSEQSSLNNARVALIQSTRKLTEMMEKSGQDEQHQLSTLSLSEFDKVRLALAQKRNKITLTSPTAGVLLYPPQSSDNKKNRVSVGSTVKAGEVLALIGDMSGIRVEVDVPEVDIDKIVPGMKASIHSISYPNEAIEGELVAINSQANSSSTSTLPSFPAIIEVKQLTDKQRAWVKVGMSASVELSADGLDKLMVPIKAVRLEQGKSLVTIKNKSGEPKDIEVRTGAALANKVIIESGLKVGDEVLYG